MTQQENIIGHLDRILTVKTSLYGNLETVQTCLGSPLQIGCQVLTNLFILTLIHGPRTNTIFLKQGQPDNGGKLWTGSISDPKRPGQHCLAYHVNTNSINDLNCPGKQRPTICQSGKGKFRHFIFRTRIFISAVHFNFSLT